MIVVYDPSARSGFRFGIELDGALVNNLSREQLESHLCAKGLTVKETRDAIVIAKANAVATSAQQAQALQRFIDASCFHVDGALIPFGEFYRRFLESLPRDEQYRWTRVRVSRALPKQNPCGSHTRNQKYIANLSWTPGTSTVPYIVIPGDKSQGRAHVLCQSRG